jgi:mitofusin
VVLVKVNNFRIFKEKIIHSFCFHLGHEERLVEFGKFEHEFEKCISKTAVQTKFEQHTNRGKGIITLLRETTANISNKSQTLKQESVQKITEMDEKNSLLERELRSMTESAKEKIRHITEDVYKRVAQTLNDEIKRYDYVIRNEKQLGFRFCLHVKYHDISNWL